MRDFIFKPQLDARGYVDRTRLKRELAGILGDRIVNGKPRYLFSSEPLVEKVGEWYRLRVMEGTAPNMPEIPLEECKAGQSVVLGMWIALDRKVFRAGEPDAALAVRCRELLQAYCAGRFGAMLDISSVEIADRIRVMSAVSKGATLFRPYGHARISGIVRDPAAVLEIQRNGIGEARAYGFGLVASQNMN